MGMIQCSSSSRQAVQFLVLALISLHVVAFVAGKKTEYACQSHSFPFCDTTKSVVERVEDLISRLDLQEKIQQLSNTAASIPRLGIPSYQWWQEALHGVAVSPGVTFNGSIKSATSFPQTILTASSFNNTLFHLIGLVVSTEARAMYNEDQTGLTFWSPNVNIFRDPRWGRGQETPGEDPVLSSNYAAAFVRGMQEMQEGEDNLLGRSSSFSSQFKLKTSACCKHFSAYDLEKWGDADRDHFNAVVTKQDMEDTFNPPFQSCIQEGRASGLMCSYNRVNDVPMCGSYSFLTETAREKWGLEGYIVSDCDAVYDMTNTPAYSETLEDAVADSLLAGLDLDCGITYRDHAGLAMTQGKLTESHLDAALRNMFAVQMRLGLYDGDPQSQRYGHLSVNDVCTEAHQSLALEAALQSIVLLKNDKNVLPLSSKHIKSLAVLGPSAMDAEYRMLGNYAGIPCVYITPMHGLTHYIPNIHYQPGCSDIFCNNTDFSDAAFAAAQADAVVIVVGLSLLIEEEGMDRTSLLLPGNQQQLVSEVAKVAKGPVVLVILSGGPVDVSFAKEDPSISSIIWAGYPGQAGGQAIAQIIFGDYNPGGKLPMTWYPESFTSVPMTNMNMRPNTSSGYPGRSYRFYTGDPVFAFGHGLSYTSFKYSFKSASSLVLVPSTRQGSITEERLVRLKDAEGFLDDANVCHNLSFSVEVLVRNQGSRSGTTVVMLYAVPPGSGKNGVAQKNLISYQRVHIQAQMTLGVVFDVLLCKDLSTVNVDGERSLGLGEHILSLGNEIQHLVTVARSWRDKLDNVIQNMPGDNYVVSS
ncbi:unnamed protein product [Calypogeia fissa]